MTTGFLHPGAMGATIAAACGDETWWVSDGRSEASRERAEAAGMRDAGSLDELVTVCDLIVSICPPDRAPAVARSVAALGFDGVFLDANAISPSTSARIATQFDRYVDGGIIGPPAVSAGTTRMYVSGAEAAPIADRWNDSVLDVRPIDGDVGAASALKMSYAAWTKGTSALLLAVNAVAEAHGVADELRAEWAISIPDLPRRSERTAAGVAPKAWRFEGEMREIASAFEAAGLPPGFHLAAADVYGRLAELRDVSDAVDLDHVVRALRGRT